MGNWRALTTRPWLKRGRHTCIIFIDALYRDIDYNDAEQMPMLAYGGNTTLQASAVLLGCPYRVFSLDHELTFEPRLRHASAAS
eukprot:363738-Pleurochrysis_carterae.AAC.1